MTNQQLYLAIGLPIIFNATMVGVVLAYMNSKFDAVDRRFVAVNTRFDDMKDLWRAELRRVEEILDSRLKHIEEQR